MLDAIKPLLDSGIINESTQQAINEAWETKLTEARESIRAELREEFAGRYEHDKSIMVEALDKMVTESLTAELTEFAAEKQALAEDRAKFATRMVEGVQKFDNFMVKNLAEEVKELRADRKQFENSIAKLEEFVIRALAEEIQEFEQDKKAVVETKVRLVAEAKEKMAQLQTAFVKRSAQLVKESVATKLESELTQLKEDVQIARENMFGRRLFEAFAGEFAVTHLNESREFAKMQSMIKRQAAQLAEARKIVEKSATIVESREREIRIIKESADRREAMTKLLKPLNKEKAAVMSELLESVQTDKLQAAFDKYLPAVLNNSPVKQAPQQRVAMLAESRQVVTGDKTATPVESDESMNNVIALRRLAGLK
jgi:hypothetical protein